jgi:mono/diheme cytochrome c family protein
LAGEVQRLNHDGIRAQWVDTLKMEGEEIGEDEVDDVFQLVATPGEVVRAPPFGPADSQAIERGKHLYAEVGCNHCHGDDGVGARDMFLADDRGRPARPRDLVREPFKGGQEPESVYLRLFVGMPGSPHPAGWTLSEEQLVDLVHYCRSLSREPKRLLTNHQQATLVTTGAYVAAFAGPAP